MMIDAPSYDYGDEGDGGRGKGDGEVRLTDREQVLDFVNSMIQH